MKSIFIIHGHNKVLLSEAKRTIRALGLKPIILSKKSNNGSLTLIEKLETKSSAVSFVITLLTNDDEGRKKGAPNIEDRARQNVIFELGYFMGKLGREKVMCLCQRGLILPSDINGVAYTEFDEDGKWKECLNTQLIRAGCINNSV